MTEAHYHPMPFAVLALSVLCASPALAQINLAAAREGAAAVASSSSLGARWGAENLIDGDAATAWASSEGKVRDEWVTVRLAGRGSRKIGSLVVDSSTADGHPPEAGLRNFRIEVSTEGRAEEDFTTVLTESCRLGGGRHTFTFAPVPAKFVKLTVRGNHGHPSWAEVAELEVYAAGEPPSGGRGTPLVMLHSRAADAADTPFAPLAASLSELGGAVTTYPGDGASAPINLGSLLGVRVVVTTGEPALKKEDLRALTRFARRGGGILCVLPEDPDPLRHLLEALDVAVTEREPAEAAVSLVPHWITDGLAFDLPPLPTHGLAMHGAEPLAIGADGTPVALAGAVADGRLAVLPKALVANGLPAPEDALELARRAVLWAAGMDTAVPEDPPEPVSLTGTGFFLDGGRGKPWERSFELLEEALEGHGLRLREAPGTIDEFSRADLSDVDLLIAFMPAFSHLTSIELTDWVRGGGALLVLGESDAEVDSLIAANQLLREFGGAVAHSPTTNIALAIRRHPATRGVDVLTRPGEPLGAWCLQGTPLAEMGSTPLAIARAFGKGKLVIMDAGLAVDPVEPDPDVKKQPPTYGIHLEDNEELLLRVTEWLLADD